MHVGESAAAGHQIDELGIAQQRGPTLAPGARAATRAAASAISRSSAWRSSVCSRLVLAPVASAAGRAGDQGVDADDTKQRRDVVGLEQLPRRHFAVLHERGLEREGQLGEGRRGHAGTPRDSQPLQHTPGERVLRCDESGRLQILADERAQVLQVVAAEEVAYAIGAGKRFGAHHVGEIRIGIGRILALPDARDLIELRPPDLVAQAEEEALHERIARQRGLRTRARLPQVERRDRQHAIRLPAGAEAGNGPPRARERGNGRASTPGRRA